MKFWAKDRFDFATKTVDHGWVAFNDKQGHFWTAFFLMRFGITFFPEHILLIAISGCILGVLWEFYEVLTKMDDFSWRDVVCDVFGILAAFLF